MDLDQNDVERVAASLAGWLERLTLVDLAADELTARIVDSVVDWAGGQGWRVYRRAASVLPLAPPYQRQYSVVDVACARPAGPPVVIEVDRAHRQRTIDKLLAEAAAGRLVIWVRWGNGGFPAPPSPIRMITYPTTRRRAAAGTGRVHSHLPTTSRPAPAHSAGPTGETARVSLPISLPAAVDPHPGG